MSINFTSNIPGDFLRSLYKTFLYSVLKRKDKHLAQSFDFNFRYIDDVLSLNNSKLVTM